MADVLMKLSRSFNYEIYHCNIIRINRIHYYCFYNHTSSILDRFNPFLKTEYSYAKVPKGTQQYVNITAYSERGEKLDYKLTFNGFSPSRTYVEIKHKGQYVISITYVEKEDIPKEVRQE